ncbi:hypothetical protein AMAG_19924 [Allomyces macrogynus ATCC 38327]|uniref:Uncharacterized protein n=1 Tax=Allomyces macrogynus (strain ATCC 38327) TaxID=578462 RepID=A0A0L0T3T9_ALLM3|nr:hypothetical protein AMAG_19924 [Allomyces macrogynus ATCC 38327]|eukprot:KNE69412.1 hypothetical protein AMAG_19924 [Allomyces macrogynus ATCC 38327]
MPGCVTSRPRQRRRPRLSQKWWWRRRVRKKSIRRWRTWSRRFIARCATWMKIRRCGRLWGVHGRRSRRDHDRHAIPDPRSFPPPAHLAQLHPRAPVLSLAQRHVVSVHPSVPSRSWTSMFCFRCCSFAWLVFFFVWLVSCCARPLRGP